MLASMHHQVLWKKEICDQEICDQESMHRHQEICDREIYDQEIRDQDSMQMPLQVVVDLAAAGDDAVGAGRCCFGLVAHLWLAPLSRHGRPLQNQHHGHGQPAEEILCYAQDGLKRSPKQ